MRRALTWQFFLTLGVFCALLLFFSYVALARQEENSGAVSGYKWYDRNGDGVKLNEPIIENWEIFLVGEDDAETNGDGYYTFDSLEDGAYAVCERAEGNWSEAYPNTDTVGAAECDENEGYAPWGWHATIEEGEVISGPESFDFGNVTRLGTTTVLKFNDLDGDGTSEEGEPGIEGVEICLDADELGDDFLDGLFEFFFPDDENEFERCKNTNAEGLAEWSNLPAGRYELEEDDIPDGWRSTTGTEREIDLEPGESEKVEFGNKRGNLVVYKYDYNEEELIPGWDICLFEAAESDNGFEPIGDAIECEDTNDDEENQFFGAAVFSVENLDPEKRYIIDEEEKFGLRLEEIDWDGSYLEAGVSDGALGRVLVRFLDSFFDEAPNAALYLYNLDVTSDLTVYKLLGDAPIAGWEICISSEEEGGAVEPSCQKTDQNGATIWKDLLPGSYILDEETRSEYGWSFGGVSGNYDEVIDEVLGRVRVSINGGENAAVYFHNNVNDEIPPVSSFNNSLDHNVIDTEIVLLELSGSSDDQPLIVGEDLGGSSGVREVTVRAYQVGGPESVEGYPSSSFFDVFAEIKCPVDEAVPVEILPLSLTSTSPITTDWSYGFTPPSAGVYCFEASASDNAGNVERTAYAGPLAYVPVVQLSNEEPSEVKETSFVVTWETDHPATSRVIYDTVSHPVLGGQPNYGYAFSTPESDTGEDMTKEHSVSISGLNQGTTYYFRTVSHGSPENVGEEEQINTSSSADVPQCSDALDNDGDGLIDRADPACTSDLIDNEVNSSGGGGGGGGAIGISGFFAPQTTGVGQAGGQVLGEFTETQSIEDQIEAIGMQIIALQERLIAVLEENVIALLKQRIIELQSELKELLN